MLVFGVGIGLFLVCLTALISILICLIGSQTRYAARIIGITTLLFLTLTLFLIIAPKQPANRNIDYPVNSVALFRGVLWVLMFGTMMFAVHSIIVRHCSQRIQGRKMLRRLR